MNFYLPTREECKQLVSTSKAFYCAERVVEGQNVEMYDYRLASYKDFFPEDGRNWSELRGLTFVQQDDGGWERNILLHKFFNANQVESFMYDDLKNKKISRVQNKEDGSIISAVRFANGKVRMKSKMSFESEQAVMAQEIYDTNKNIRIYVDYCIGKNLVPIFELVGYENAIVINYDVASKLILLQVRYGIDGEYMNEDDYEGLIEVKRRYHIDVTPNFHTKEIDGVSVLDQLLERKRVSQDEIEGWVVTFEDGQMAKIKTDRYLQLHGLIGPDAFRENLLIEAILEGNIDDVISALVPGPKKDMILSIEEKVSKKFNNLVVEFKELRGKYFNVFKEDRKNFAMKHSKDRLFSSVMKTMKTSFRDIEKTAEAQVKLHILKQCNSLSDAKTWINLL